MTNIYPSVLSSITKKVVQLSNSVTGGLGGGGGDPFAGLITDVTDSLLSERVADRYVFSDAGATTDAVADGNVIRWKNHLGVASASTNAGTLRLARQNERASIEVSNSKFVDSTVVASSQAMTLCYVLKTRRRQSSISVQFAGVGASPFIYLSMSSGFPTLFDANGSAVSNNTNYQGLVPADYFVLFWTCGPSSCKLRVNGQQQTITGAMSATSKTGLHFGLAAGGTPLPGELLYEAAWDKVLSDAEILSVEERLNLYYSLPAAIGSRLCWWEGDSIAQAIYVVLVADEHQIKANADLASGDRYSVRSSAVQSSRTAEVTSRQSFVNAQADAATSTNKVLNLWVGSNDLVGGKSAATLRTDVIALCDAYRSHFDKIVIWDVLPRAAIEAVRTTYNSSLATDFGSTTAYTRIKTGASYADYLVQIGSDPTIGPEAAIANTAYYPDAIHPSTVASQTIIADYGTKVLTLCL